ncbi:MAG: hypothetical protein JO193_09805 [Candidatus Eremiobacteraeota bacterium]|nr:hypothetical protein [Candidatus Eremiobacteraeota bacterium]MBV9972275.1 hypothetical protein [Candidatus Eremiobacteraeota bacterium]
MRLEVSGGTIHVTLSKRNLLALLEKLTWNSARTIRFQADEATLVVSAEPDELHYANRAPPGPMINARGEMY